MYKLLFSKKFKEIELKNFFVSSNFYGGLGGLILYPSLQFLTAFPIGKYAAVCYSVHHIHIIQQLKNMVITIDLTDRNEYTHLNYIPFYNKYILSTERRSIYSVNLDGEKIQNMWFCPTLNPYHLSHESISKINDIVTCRDNITKTSILLFFAPLAVMSFMPFGIVLSTKTSCLMGLGFFGIYSGCAILTRKEICLKSVIEELRKHNVNNNKYFYINTFGNIVFTDWRFGLYTRYMMIKN